jgi:hypothetical protein
VALWRRVARWISKATSAPAHARARAPTPTRARTHILTYAYTHTQKYAILTGLPWIRWFHEGASVYILRTLPIFL